MRRQEWEESILGLVLPTGAVRRRDLGLDSTGRRALDGLLCEGVIALRDGVVHLPEASALSIAAARERAALSCGAAVAWFGLPEPLAPCDHLAVPASRGVVRTAWTVHREVGLGAHERVVPPDVLAARLLRCASPRDAVAVVDQILHRGLATREDIAARLRGRTHGCPRARALLARCTGAARSLIESYARFDLEAAGHRVEPAVVVDGVGEVDMLVDGCLFVETDGYAFHSRLADWSHDREREQAMAARGLRWVRITYQQVMAGEVVAIVEAVLAGLRGGN